MKLPDRFFSLAGFSMKAGKCMAGAFACEKAVKSGRARLVLVDSSVSERTRKDVRAMCEYYDTPFVLAEPDGRLAQSLGKDGKKMFAVCDDGFANKLIDIYKESCEQLPEV